MLRTDSGNWRSLTSIVGVETLRSHLGLVANRIVDPELSAELRKFGQRGVPRPLFRIELLVGLAWLFSPPVVLAACLLRDTRLTLVYLGVLAVMVLTVIGLRVAEVVR